MNLADLLPQAEGKTLEFKRNLSSPKPLLKTLVHADYSQRGAPIRIAFFDDRIEIENPGILLPGLTIEDMKQGVSKIRNPVIARVFRELHLIEQRADTACARTLAYPLNYFPYEV